ncbi:NAD(P)/FAD-dependent oxidoreductase [Paenibacillus sp. PR3]|uniref:NAD(P)/FAD-dependent oxidoreductase n=1 Tax=Paenibacillus terricola TaxID=2763503 RepID=A0ABR8MTI4_9BACL|nr:NAD(P)/FAD-dependent oxidoreductase [Paenibacillus terricola]MBD3917464.1 NAD(P)/FAD-dependent oxidoreductase [Paenibacillus terricola]
MKRVIILGGGYGGQSVANELIERGIPSDTIVTLIDRMPFQGLKTEYYALAAGTVSDHQLRVAFPSDPKLLLMYGEVLDVDMERQVVVMEDQNELEYDSLVIALGCTDKFHGINGAEEYACTIQTFSAARNTYQQLNDLKAYGQVSIVGGGLSGVEVAAELRESRPDLNIRIIDRGPSVMSAFPEKLQNYVADWFREHSVDMMGHVALSQIEPGILHDSHSDKPIYTDVTVWTAGIQPVELVQRMDLPKDPSGRLVINELHQLPAYTNVYIVGDCASMPFAPSGQAAGAQGKQVAEVIHAIWNGQTPKLGKIKLKGTLGSLGKKAGFGLMGKTALMGRVPRLLKTGVLWKSKHHIG